MTEPEETLSSLVRSQVGPGGVMTYQAFLDRAIDPESGYKPSISILQSLMKGQRVKIHPPLVRAVAAGLQGISERRAKAAAHREYIDPDLPVVADDPFRGEHSSDVEVTLARVAGASPEALDAARAVLMRVLREIENEGGQAPPTPKED